MFYWTLIFNIYLSYFDHKFQRIVWKIEILFAIIPSSDRKTTRTLSPITWKIPFCLNVVRLSGAEPRVHGGRLLRNQWWQRNRLLISAGILRVGLGEEVRESVRGVFWVNVFSWWCSRDWVVRHKICPRDVLSRENSYRDLMLTSRAFHLIPHHVVFFKNNLCHRQTQTCIIVNFISVFTLFWSHQGSLEVPFRFLRHGFIR